MTYHITDAVGNTPLVKLRKVVDDDSADVYVKLEYFNPTGSYKDRMALAIIEEAEKRGDLQKGKSVVECTGGSTGTSLAFVCSVKNYHFKVVSSDAFAAEKLHSMRLFGADLELILSEGGKITPNLIPDMINRVKAIQQETGAYWPNQFENRDALKGYQNLGNEIIRQLDKPVNVFCAAVGTAGMITGVSDALKRVNTTTRIIGLEPASAPLISQGIKGSHKVDGVGVGFIPPLFNRSDFDDIQTVEEAEARIMAKRLATEEGIFAGTSSGLNVAAAIRIARQLGRGQTVVTVAVDSGMKYLAGGLFD
ncbi:cysteine synthase A [Pseudarcicella hirudinis]|uniref:cysteine synthase n=1 Tax=Pseudarcicella hirudinis TaxID=1079859 RepID=A0A1I5MQS6_9BACT|nr:cysteine synthase family protein [Pseudarcicella hirudinis]SFP11945.1 cysteine synthase A [Pseudarcicella hirudinis]